MPTSRTPLPCPCGSGAAYAACCGPLHRGRTDAATAEALMRSRYSAFVLQDAGYLLVSWHPSTRPPSLAFEANLSWQRLEVLAGTAGGADDQRGEVEFVAHFLDTASGQSGQQHERSVFLRDGGRWRYVGPAA